MLKMTAVVTIALTLGACGSATSDGNESSLTIGGTKMELNRQKPVTMPTYAPFYPGATVVESVVTTHKGGKPSSGTLVMETVDPAAKVMAFYEQAAKAGGLAKDLVSAPAADGVGIITYSAKESGRTFNVTTQPADEGHRTKVTLLY